MLACHLHCVPLLASLLHLCTLPITYHRCLALLSLITYHIARDHAASLPPRLLASSPRCSPPRLLASPLSPELPARLFRLPHMLIALALAHRCTHGTRLARTMGPTSTTLLSARYHSHPSLHLLWPYTSDLLQIPTPPPPSAPFTSARVPHRHLYTHTATPTSLELTTDQHAHSTRRTASPLPRPHPCRRAPHCMTKDACSQQREGS